MSWSFSWLRRWDEVFGSRNLPEWLAPFQPGSGALVSPFMHPDFARAWLAAVGGPDALDPFFLRAASSDGREALWLMVRPKPAWRRGGVRSLVPVGSPVAPHGQRSKLAAYYEPVFTRGAPDAEDLAGFWDALLHELEAMSGNDFDAFWIPRFRVGCVGSPPGAEPHTTAPYLRLSPYADAEGYLQARKARVRSAIRRRLRNLDAAGRVELKVHGPEDVEQVIAWLPRMLAERRRRYGAQAPCDGFLPGMVRRGLGDGLVHASTLLLDGREISWMFGYLLQDVYHGYYRAFDPAFERLSPGVVHFFRLLEWMFDNGVHTVDFGIDAHRYKAEWTDGEAWEVRSLRLRSWGASSLARRSAAATIRRATQLAERVHRSVAPALVLKD